MVSKKLAIEVLNEALATGADYAEIFYEDSHAQSLSIENGKVETSTSNSMNGVGLRLLKENQCVYGYTNDLTKKGLISLAQSLRSSFKGERKISTNTLLSADFSMQRGSHDRDMKASLAFWRKF